MDPLYTDPHGDIFEYYTVCGHPVPGGEITPGYHYYAIGYSIYVASRGLTIVNYTD